MEGLPSYREAARQGQAASIDDPQAKRIRDLEAKIAALEGELGRNHVEVRFFRSALRRVEASRQANGEHGGTASTWKSAAGNRKAN
jgi:hypothetical protein